MRYLFTILIIMVVSFPCVGHDQWDYKDDGVFTGATDLGKPTSTLQSHGLHTIGGTSDTYDWFKVTLDEGIFYEFTVTPYDVTYYTQFIFGLYKLDYTTTILITENRTGSTRADQIVIDYMPEKSDIYYLRVTGSGAYYLHYLSRPIPTPTPTLTPTWTYTPTSTFTFTPSFTVTPTPINTPTFTTQPAYTFTPIPQIQPAVVYQLENEEFALLHGGFTNPPMTGGTTTIGEIPLDEFGLSDGRGAKITTASGQVEFLIFPKVECGEQLIFMRAWVRASEGGVAVALAALDGSMDGSIATNIPMNSVIFKDRYHPMLLLFDPPGTECYTDLSSCQ